MYNIGSHDFVQTSSSWKAQFHRLLEAGPLRSPPAPRDNAPNTSAMFARVRAAIPADLHSAPTKHRHIISQLLLSHSHSYLLVVSLISIWKLTTNNL